MPSLDNDNVSLSTVDKMNNVSINDSKTKESQHIQEESKDVKNSDLPKEQK